jgi:sugar phosphate isomerase/epimerase
MGAPNKGIDDDGRMNSDTDRLVSIAAGVTPELFSDPAAFIAAAAEAQWPATGVWYEPESWTPQTTTEVRRRLDDTGLIAVDMEVVRMGPKGDVGMELIDAAAAVGAGNILTISTFDDPAETASRLADLCAHAAPAGIRVCIEFMRFTSVKTLADAIEVVTLADQPNAGILVDLIHVFRSGTTYDDIRAADPALFPYAQWCDGAAEPRGWETRDLIIDAVDDRSIPGEGGLDALAFSDLFAPEVPLSLEIRSKALREAFPDPVVRAAHVLSKTLVALP